MSKNLQLRFLGSAVLVIAWLGASAALADRGVVVVRVKCDLGKSINQALERNADELVVEIEGVCREDVLIRRDRTTLRGVTADAAVVGSLEPPLDFGGGVTVVGASNVTLADFTVRDGRRGVTVLSGGSVRLERMSLQDHLRDGLFLFHGSEAKVADCAMVGNGSYGAGVWNGSHLWVAPGATLAANGNGLLGLLASGNSTVATSSGSRIEVDDNGSYGLVMQLGGAAQIRPALSTLSARRNGFAGLVSFYGGTLHANGEVRDNAIAGAYVGFRSSLDLDGPLTDNGVFGIWAEQDASVDYSGYEISGHDIGMYLDGTEAYVNDATVTDLVQLVFGTRADFAGGNSFTGGVICDQTVLVRGDVSCPPPARSAAALGPELATIAAGPDGPLALEP